MRFCLRIILRLYSFQSHLLAIFSDTYIAFLLIFLHLHVMNRPFYVMKNILLQRALYLFTADATFLPVRKRFHSSFQKKCSATLVPCIHQFVISDEGSHTIGKLLCIFPALCKAFRHRIESVQTSVSPRLHQQVSLIVDRSEKFIHTLGKKRFISAASARQIHRMMSGPAFSVTTLE